MPHDMPSCRWIAPVYLLGVYLLLNLGNIAALQCLGPPPRPPPAPPPQEDEYVLGPTGAHPH